MMAGAGFGGRGESIKTRAIHFTVAVAQDGRSPEFCRELAHVKALTQQIVFPRVEPGTAKTECISQADFGTIGDAVAVIV